MGDLISPRPIFKKDEVPKNKKVERLLMGSQTSGIVFDVARKGLTVNGYYPGGANGTLYGILSKPIEIPWDELDKMRKEVFRVGKKKVQIEFDIDDNPNQKYLDKLPKVTILGKRYYIDASRKERRPVDHPERVYTF
ncbi:hypothetical protein DRN34_03815 [Thermococci archaeon]|nr:MAG: hypothetical protein DRN34_03815 [Thermococci archaeon]